MARKRKAYNLKTSTDWKAPKASDFAEVKRVQTPVSISFLYVQHGSDFCLSQCDSAEVANTIDCLRQLTTLAWSDVLGTGGKNKKRKGKVGLGHTVYEDRILKRVKRPPQVSPDLSIAGVRASQQMRVYGVYKDHVFYVIWFDPNHEIVPVKRF